MGVDKEEMIQLAVRTFASGATRGSNKDKLDYEGFFNPAVLRTYARYMHKHRKQMDGSLRDSDNWQKGMPTSEYMKSLLRHTMDAWLIHRKEGSVVDPETGEPVMMSDACCGILFNTMGILLNLIKGRD